MRKFFCALFLAFFLFCNVFGQKNFLPGYILSTSKDTIKGFVDYRNWEKNPSKILFKQVLSDPEKNYGVKDIEGFEVYGFDVYKKAIVLLDMNPVNIDQVYKELQTGDKRDTVFLRFLAEGRNLKLYEFVDKKYHFFMQKGDGLNEELIYKLLVDEASGNLRTVNGYMRQIKTALAETSITSEQSRAIDRLRYNTDELKKFFLRLDGNVEKTGTVAGGKNNKKSSQFFVGAGITYQQFGFSSGNTVLKSLSFDHTLSYIIAGGVDFFSNRNFRNLVMRGELSLSEFHAKGSGKSSTGLTGVSQHNEYSFKQINITPTLSFLYNFFATRKTKPYIGISVGYNFSTYPEHISTSTNELTGYVRKEENFPEFEKGWIGTYIRAGVVTNEKFELGLMGQVGGSFLNYTGTGEKSHPISLRFSYRF